MEERITTSKGTWIVSDEKYYLINENRKKIAYLNGIKQFEFEKFIELSFISEEQASDIVSSLVKDENGNKSYIYTLHSLLKSKGINDLTNKYIFKV